jgi:hypothetical protein
MNNDGAISLVSSGNVCHCQDIVLGEVMPLLIALILVVLGAAVIAASSN